MSDTSPELEFSLILHPSALSDQEHHVDMVLADDVCVRLAKRFCVSEVSGVRVQLTIRREGQGLRAVGCVTGSVIQPCAISLEPVTTAIYAAIDHSFQPESYIQSLGLDPDDLEADIPELMSADGAEIGGVCLEEFALEIPLYPRADGVALTSEHAAELGLEAPTSPFAVLETLKKNS